MEVDFGAPWRILSSTPGNPAADLAAAELAETLNRITGQPVPVVSAGTQVDGPVIELAHADGPDDGYTWRVAPGRIELHGQSGRGLLYAAYSFLEALGCRWVAPGQIGERLPQGSAFQLPAGPLAEAPGLAGRCLVIGHYAFMEQVEEWIVWAARNRLNTVFLHVTDSGLPFGAAPERQWQRHRAAAVALARQRGMVIEHGGHGLSALLPRRLFRRIPGAFRLANGHRTPDHNLCPSSAEAGQIVRQNAAAYFAAHPEVDVFHLWPDDIPGGGWCECERCRQYSASEQALLATNLVAEALETVNNFDAQLAFLAYHDTESLPRQVAPRRNVCLLWAPRMRCYAHGAADPACPVNVPRYRDTFGQQVSYFGRPARVFEYYLDAILFKSVLPPLPSVLASDLRFYQAAGAHTVQALMTGNAPWPNAQLNAWLFARLAWNPAQEVEAALAEFCSATFASDSPELPAYYRALERAFALALDLVPEQIRLSFALRHIWHHPPTDMGDPVFAPPEALARKAERNKAIVDLIQAAERHLQAARDSANPEAWAAERVALELMGSWLAFDLGRVRLYTAVAARASLPEVRQRLVEAQSALEAVLSWADRYLKRRCFRVNFRLLHWIMWKLRLDWIRAERLGRPWIKIGRLVQVLGLLLTFRRCYR